MKLLIDILHPAHVHFFRNFITEMKNRGHTLLVTARKKDVATDLLEEYGIEHTIISAMGKGKIGLGKELLSRNWRMYKLCRKFKPDLLTGVMGPSIATMGALLRIPRIVFYNNENAHATNWFVYPLANAVCTSSSYAKKINGNHITYQGYHEFAYLHPTYFTPEKTKVMESGINPDKPYILVRFVSWQASHDVGQGGLTDKIAVIRQLQRYGKVYITSESSVPPELQRHVLKLKQKKDLFHAIAYASLVFGEGATIASEAAMLGTPAVYVNSLQLGYLQEQERDYGLVHNFTTQEPALQKAIEILKTKNAKQEYHKRREKLLSEKIDVTQWMVEFVEKFLTS